MIHHIVIWTLKDESMGNAKVQNARLIKEKLMELKNLIPQLVKLEVGLSLNNTYSNADIVLQTSFNNIEEYNAYQNHPDHKAVGQFIASVVSDRKSVDFED